MTSVDILSIAFIAVVLVVIFFALLRYIVRSAVAEALRDHSQPSGAPGPPHE